MKVLHVVASLSAEWGGPVPVVKGIAEGLARRGIKVKVVATQNKKGPKNLIALNDVETELFDQDWLSQLWTAHSFKLARAIAQEAKAFDLIHIHEIWHHPNFAGYRAAKRTKKPYIITLHGALEPQALRYKALKKRLYTALIQRRILENAAVLHTFSTTEAQCVQEFGINTPISVIPNGINISEFRDLPPRLDFEKRYPQVCGKKVILFLGRIHPIKGLDLLAKAFGQIARYIDDVSLVIAGPDEYGYQAKVQNMLQAEGVLNKVIFTGLLKEREKLAALARADIFVLPSYSEGFSIATLEAMICGLPLIITHQCHFPEVAEAEAGIVIDPNVNQLASALSTLVDNPKLCKEMGANGRQLVLEKFTWDKIANRILELYRRVLEGQVKSLSCLEHSCV